MAKPDPGPGRDLPKAAKKPRRTSKRASAGADGAGTKLLDPILHRAYLAIYKAVSDGLPTPLNPGLADAGKPSMQAWRESETVSRLLSEREAQAAADLASWVLEAAIDALLQVKTRDAERHHFDLQRIALEASAIPKRYKFKAVKEGRQQGTKSTIERADAARTEWFNLITEMRKSTQRAAGRKLSKPDLYERIVETHGAELKAAGHMRAFSTVRHWM